MSAEILNMTSLLSMLNAGTKILSLDGQHSHPQLVAMGMTLKNPSDKQLQDDVIAKRLLLPIAPVADIPGLTPKMPSPY